VVCSGIERGCSSVAGQRFLVQLSAKPLGGSTNRVGTLLTATQIFALLNFAAGLYLLSIGLGVLRPPRNPNFPYLDLRAPFFKRLMLFSGIWIVLRTFLAAFGVR